MIETDNFIVLGTGGNFTFQVLKTLIDRGVKPRGYIQWQAPAVQNTDKAFGLPIEVSNKPAELASYLHKHNVLQQYKSNELATQIAQFSTQYCLIACWPVLISAAAIQAVSCAAMNLHPSLLPNYRGIDPIGEQLAAGDDDFAVTLHLLNEHYDQGDIVLQQRLPTLSTLHRRAIETACARAGAELFVEALKIKATGEWKLQRQPILSSD